MVGNTVNNEERMRIFAEAIIANHKDETEKNILLWREGVVMLAEHYLELLKHIDYLYNNVIKDNNNEKR